MSIPKTHYTPPNCNYLYIINNLFSCLHCFPLHKLSSLINPHILIAICVELNKQTFSDFQQQLLESFSYGIIYNETSKIIKQLQLEIKELLTNIPIDKLDYFMELNIVDLLNNNLKEIQKLAMLLIVYAFNSINKNNYIIKTKEFPEKVQNDIWKLLNNFSIINNECDSVNNGNNSKDKVKELESKVEQMEKRISELMLMNENLQKQSEITINNLTQKINMLNDKIKMCDYKNVTFKDYNQLIETSEKYYKLLRDYDMLKETLSNKEKERETTGESVRSSCNQNSKWELNEQDYLNIILKKDYEIQKLKEELANKNNHFETEPLTINNNNTTYFISQNELKHLSNK